MSTQNDNLRSANEIGKIYNSLNERKSLCEFFPTSVMSLIDAETGYLFLVGREDQLWLETSTELNPKSTEELKAKAAASFQSGKPEIKDNIIFTPLVVRSEAIGVACYMRTEGEFSQSQLEVAFDLACQMAGALKNILLIEENVEMAKLSAIGKSMGMVMHEIKNIIQLATFAEEWLTRGMAKDKKEYLERGTAGIQKALKEMNGFVHEMLSLTKNYQIQPTKVNLNNLFDELAGDLKQKANDYHVDLSFHVEDSLGDVDLEERSMYRALLNMIKNGMEACDKENSYIKVNASSRDKDFYTISIADNGMGMNDEVKAKLFSAFFSTKGEKGTGLGIMIVDRTLKNHGGKMTVESEEGKGTTFLMTLPKVIAAPNAA